MLLMSPMGRDIVHVHHIVASLTRPIDSYERPLEADAHDIHVDVDCVLAWVAIDLVDTRSRAVVVESAWHFAEAGCLRVVLVVRARLLENGWILFRIVHL